MLWLGITFISLCAFWLCRPLLKPNHPWQKSVPHTSADANTLLEELSDLQNDHLIGKLNQSDFQAESDILQVAYLKKATSFNPPARSQQKKVKTIIKKDP